MTLKLLRTTFLLAIVAFCVVNARAQSRPQITQAIDASVRHTIANSVPAEVHSASDLGRASTTLPMKDMMLRLKPSAAQTASLARFMDDVQNAKSPSYHHWLTPAQFGAQYGVADADVQTITAWLVANGFTVHEVAKGKGWIRFSGTAGQVENAFATEIHGYQAAGVKHYANALPISLPQALAPAVAGLVSLNSFIKSPLHTDLAQLKRGANGKLLRASSAAPVESGLSGVLDQGLAAHPNFTSQGSPEETFLTPGDFAKIYNTSSLLSAGNDGTGVSIAIVGRSDISLSDVEAFRTVFALPFNDPAVIYASSDPGVISGDDEEAILDLEWSGAVAPKAKINYVIGASTYSTDGVDISAAYIVDNAVAPIMSVSFGVCEQKTSQDQLDFYNNLWKQAAAEGISVFVSSGDAGSSACDVPSEYRASKYGLGVNALASTPYNTAVGGTEFADTDVNSYWNTTVGADQSSAKGYIPEAVWNESCNTNLSISSDNCFYDPTYEQTYATGGGASNCSVHPVGGTASILTGLYDCTKGYAKPSWQTGTGVPSDGARDLPDVSLAAASLHDGYMICYNGSCQWTTSSNGVVTLDAASIIGGTSAASPSMAGIMALVEQENGTFQGLANYKLYALAAQQSDASACDASAETDPTQSNSCVFHDVTAGSNALSCQIGKTDCTVAISGSTSFGLLTGYTAGAGYDLASGLGSVNAANLVTAWSNLSTLPTKTTLAVSSTSFVHGSSVHVTAKVSPASGAGTPSGQVALKASGTGLPSSPIASDTLTSGKYSAAVGNLPGGTYQLTASYPGDATYASSVSAPVSMTVTPENSVLTPGTFAPSRFSVLGRHPIVSATTVTLGTSFFIQVQVAGNSGKGVATGTVALSDGTKTFGTYPLDHDGSIYIECGPETACDYPLGNYTFTATYSGDSSFNASTVTFPFAVTQGRLNYAVSISSATPPAGTTVIGQVYFEYDPAVLPTGQVTLNRDDTNAVLASGSIGSDGVANIPFVAAAGTYNVTATYAGDANYTQGTLVEYPQLTTTAAGSAATTLTLTPSSTVATMGGRTQITLLVNPVKSASTVPTGTVTLHSPDGSQSLTYNLTGGQVSTYLTWNTAGAQSYYATYNGDANFAGSNTSLTTFNVAQAKPSIQLQTLSSYAAVGAQTSVTASFVSALSSTSVTAPTGTIQFYDSVAGAAPVAIGTALPMNTGNASSLVATLAPVLPQGSNSITAVYSGDSNWASTTSTAAVTVLVTTPDFTATATPASLVITAGQTATVAIDTQSILGFTTPIALSCGTLPVGIACDSVTVTPGASGSITLTSTAPGTAANSASAQSRMWFTASGGFAMAGLLLLVSPKRRRYLRLFSVLFAMSLALAATGCGGGSAKTTSMALTSSSTKAAFGVSINLQATLSSTDAVTGTVTFYDGTTSIGSSAVTNGSATLSTSALAVGTHPITAKYSGDNHNQSSQSADTLEQTVTGAFTLTLNATAGTLSHSISVPATLQ